MNRSINNTYVSRAGDKLASVSKTLGLNFSGATVLDVGSSTGGFTDFALQNGAKVVYAVDSGTEQLHPKLRGHARIKLFEKTDIRDFVDSDSLPKFTVIVIDVSFVSLRDILPSIAHVAGNNTAVVAMVKPQFEAKRSQKVHGIIKNDTVRREVLKDFENWVKQGFTVLKKADSTVAGLKGNKERFYLLKRLV